jgi:type 1 fimbriae regulatory protein FimB
MEGNSTLSEFCEELPSPLQLFVSERQSKLTRFAVNYLVDRTAKLADFDNLHPHCLRHSCGYALADKGIDLRTIQEWLGHRSIEMTVRYTRISQRRFSGLWRSVG